MCYDSTAKPPHPPVAGGSGPGRQLTLTAEDGNRLLAFSALTERPTSAGIVILPDVRGLHPFYEELALQFTGAGINATAIDYFGRTASTSARDESFDFTSHVAQTKPETIEMDIAAAVEHLRSGEGGASPNVFTVGFCFGGRVSFNQSANEGLGLSGVIGFYGRVAEREPGDPYAPVKLVPRYRAPVLGLFGGADSAISSADVDAFRAALDTQGIENEIVSYEGAPHSFFDRAYEQHRDACDDSWRRMLQFIKRFS